MVKASFRINISEHEPRKGTETFSDAELMCHGRDQISEHEPRKGTETCRVARHGGKLKPHFRTRTPKGDGNPRRAFDEHIQVFGISEHEPRKGTETIPLDAIRVPVAISEHEPRKGTETRLVEIRVVKVPVISEHEPRKGTETMIKNLYHSSRRLFQNTNPERGRKLWARREYRRVYPNFRTRTPKGDGNVIIGQASINPRLISEHEPRKGTETMLF